MSSLKITDEESTETSLTHESTEMEIANGDDSESVTVIAETVRMMPFTHSMKIFPSVKKIFRDCMRCPVLCRINYLPQLPSIL